MRTVHMRTVHRRRLAHAGTQLLNKALNTSEEDKKLWYVRIDTSLPFSYRQWTPTADTYWKFGTEAEARKLTVKLIEDQERERERLPAGQSLRAFWMETGAAVTLADYYAHLRLDQDWRPDSCQSGYIEGTQVDE